MTDTVTRIVQEKEFSHLTEAAMIELANLARMVAGDDAAAVFHLKDAVEPRTGMILGEYKITVECIEPVAFIEEDDTDGSE